MISKEIFLEIQPDNIGSFIGSNGKNFKKIIAHIKKKIIGKKEITNEEWNKIKIDIKFEKQESNVKTIINCEEDHLDIIIKSLNLFVDIHNTENKKYEMKKLNGIDITYRIGIEHRFIGRLIGQGGSNILQLKNDLSELPYIEKVNKIVLEEQKKKYNIKFRNIGKKNSLEHIMMFIKIKGKINNFEEIQNIIETYIKTYTYEEGDEEEDEDVEDEEDDGDEDDGDDGDEKGEDWHEISSRRKKEM